MYLIWLAIFGNGGFGGWGNNAASGTVTRAELADGLNNQTVLNDLNTIGSNLTNGVNTISNSLCNGFSGVNSNVTTNANSINNNMLGGMNNIGMSILQNSNGIVNAINQAAAQQQLANCSLSHAIQDNKYEMAQNTCAITNAVHQEGETTRKALIDQQIQDLRDSREAVQRDLQSAQITLANANQTQNILGSLGRYVAYTGCGTNCNCNSSF